MKASAPVSNTVEVKLSKPLKWVDCEIHDSPASRIRVMSASLASVAGQYARPRGDGPSGGTDGSGTWKPLALYAS